jgi:hypothetical protein
MRLEDAIQKYVAECRNGRLSCGPVRRATNKGSHLVNFCFAKDQAYWLVVAKLDDGKNFVSGEDLDDALYDEAVLCFNFKLADLGW